VLRIADIFATVAAVFSAVPHILAHIAAVFPTIPTILNTVADRAGRAGTRGARLRLANGGSKNKGESSGGDEQCAAHLVISLVWAVRYGTAVT
jgi:hypothetical protein